MPKIEVLSGTENGGASWTKIRFWPASLSNRVVRHLHATVGWPKRGTYIFDDRGNCTNSYNTFEGDEDNYAQDDY